MILETTSYMFFLAVKFLKATKFGFIFSLHDHQEQEQEQTPSSSGLDIVREHLSLTTFGETKNKTETNEQCPVCLKCVRSNDQVFELDNCSHVFHKHCLERWVMYDAKMTCPLCRAPLINLNESNALPASISPVSQPSWAVEQLLYFFGDDLLRSSSSSYAW